MSAGAEFRRSSLIKHRTNGHQNANVKELLAADEHESARASTLNAHYTSATVISAIYDAIQRLGFEHGRVLEPALGVGHFFGLMPAEMQARSQLTGVEIDPLSASIARRLYPGADIRTQGFEAAALPQDWFDLAVSNVPFGDYKLHDPEFNEHNFLIHDYFFAKAIAKVRPGGLVVFVTSRVIFVPLNNSVRTRSGYVPKNPNPPPKLHLCNHTHHSNLLLDTLHRG
jgi:adenine-specific DNA methylase